jgi:O-antigen/teichoic acid export membrane protein
MMKSFPMLKSIKTLLTTSLVYGLGNVASKFIGFFFLPVFTRYLSPSEFGLFDTFSIILFLTTTISLIGTDSAMSRFYYDSEQSTDRQRTITSTIILSCGRSLLLSAIGLFFSNDINTILFGNQNYASIYKITLWTLPFSVFNSLVFALQQTKREPLRYSILTLARFALIYGISVYLLSKGLSVLGVLESHLISYGVASIIGIWWIRRDVAPKVSLRIIKEMIVFGFPLSISSLAIWLLSSSDRFFLLKFSTLQELGLYSIGYRMASIVAMSVMAFQLAWPQFIYSIAKEENVKYVLARLFTYYLFVGFFLILAVTLFSPELLKVLTTSAYTGASSVILLLSTSFLLLGAFQVFGVALSIIKKTISFLPVTAMAAVVSVSLNFYLVPRFGKLGAGISSVAAYATMTTLMYFSSRRFYPIRYEWDRIIKLACVSGTILVVHELIPTTSLLVAVVFKSAMLLSYFIILAALSFFNVNERQALKGLVKKYFRLAW